jgi:hypothetical protein
VKKEEYIEFIKFDNKSGKKCNEHWLKKNISDIYNDIIKYTKHLNINFNVRVYHYVNDLKEIPECLNPDCHNIVRFNYKNGKGYAKYCCSKCSNSDLDKINLTKNNNLIKYGTVCNLQTDDSLNKSKKTLLEKYNVEHYSKSDDFKEKIRETSLERYGVSHPTKSNDIKQKIINSFIEKYGVSNPMKLDDIKEKSKNTCLNKYGVDNPMKLDKIKNKIKNNNLLKYNVDHFNKTEEGKNRIRNAFLEHFGETSFFKTNMFKENMKEMNISKYKTKYSKLLNLKEDDICVDGVNVTINNYCHKHQSFVINKNNLYYRNRFKTPLCTECYPINDFSSIKERYLREWLEDNNIEYITNSRKIIPRMELDIYIPDKNIAIEFNGLYWHSTLYKNEKYHYNKFKMCKEYNIMLIQIFEDDLFLYEKEIKKFILQLIKEGNIQLELLLKMNKLFKYDDFIISDNNYPLFNCNELKMYQNIKPQIWYIDKHDIFKTKEYKDNYLSLYDSGYTVYKSI